MAGDEEDLLRLMVAPDSVARLAAGCMAAACRASPRAAAEGASMTEVHSNHYPLCTAEPLPRLCPPRVLPLVHRDMAR